MFNKLFPAITGVVGLIYGNYLSDYYASIKLKKYKETADGYLGILRDISQDSYLTLMDKNINLEDTTDFIRCLKYINNKTHMVCNFPDMDLSNEEWNISHDTMVNSKFIKTKDIKAKWHSVRQKSYEKACVYGHWTD